METINGHSRNEWHVSPVCSSETAYVRDPTVAGPLFSIRFLAS